MMQTDYQKEWEQILSSPNLQQSLLNHFKTITDSDESLTLLQLVVACVKEASVRNEKLVLTFENGKVLQCAAPDRSGAYNNWPTDFQRIMSIHTIMEFGVSNMMFARNYFLGDHGTFIIENDDYENCESPMIDDASDWWIYENETGELLLISHENEAIVERSSRPIWNIFLQRIAKSLKAISQPLPDTEKKGLRKASSSVIELKSEAETLIGVKRVVDSGRILNIGGEFALMEWRDKKLEVLSTTSFHPLISSELVQFQILDTNRIFFAIEERSCHFINLNNLTITIPSEITFYGNKAPCLVDDRIYFYKKGYPEGFSRVLITDGSKKETFQNRPSTGLVNFSRSFAAEGVVLFTGTRLIGFNVTAEKPVELFNVNSQIMQPNIAPLKYPFVLLYETFYNDSKQPAIVILDITSGKIIASYRPGEFVQAIHCTQNELVFLTKRKNQHFLLKYNVSGESLELTYEIKLHFDNRDNPVEFVQQVENTLKFIDREGCIFSFEP